MRQFFRNSLAVLVFAFLFSLAASGASGEADLVITSLDYTNDFENGDPVTIVQSGRDDDTEYKYNFYDDDDDNCGEQRCLPNGWFEKNFDDSGWSSGAAPFGNDDQAGASPGTIWQSEDGLNDYVVIRHQFTYSNEYEVISATLNLAHNNYYVAYLNGNLIRDCDYYQNHNGCYEGDAEYWDNVLTYDGSSESGPNPDWLLEGTNVLAILGIDITYGGDTDQWIDVELVVNVQSWREKPIILGDDLWFRVITSNLGTETAENFNVTLDIEGDELGNATVSELAPDATAVNIFYWTPEALGDYSLTATTDADADVVESNEDNNALERVIHIGFYAYNLTVMESHVTGNVSENISFQLNLTNEGDVEDNFTIQISGAYYSWDVTITPNVVHLQPGESGNVTLDIIPDSETLAGNYSMSLSARSQYYSEIRNIVVLSGRDNDTEWWWAHSNSSSTQLYQCTDNDEPDDPGYECDTSWTELDFDYDDNWTLDPAPFGDGDVGNVDNNTVWQGNSYAYFRHIFTIDDVSAYGGGSLSLNTAANNYGTYYLNSQIVFNDMRQGQGHTANYWNDETPFGPGLLQEGENVLASVVRETGNTQWFDEEMEAVFSRSAAWDFIPLPLELEMEVLPSYKFELQAPSSNKELDAGELYTWEIWVHNQGNIIDTYDVQVSLNDTTNFTLLNWTTSLSVGVSETGSMFLNISLAADIIEGALGGLNVTAVSRDGDDVLEQWVNLAVRLYVPPDYLPPQVFILNETGLMVNSSIFPIEWYVADWYKALNGELEFGNDTVTVVIEYRSHDGDGNWIEGYDENGTANWAELGAFAVELEAVQFDLGVDGRSFCFHAEGIDDDGNRQDAEDECHRMVIVDLTAPPVELVVSYSPPGTAELVATSDGMLLNQSALDLRWSSIASDVAGYDLLVGDGSGWQTLRSGTVDTRYDFYAPQDGEYRFRVIAADEAGNRGSAAEHTVIIDTTPPVGTLHPQPALTGATQITLLPDGLTQDMVSYELTYTKVSEGQELSTSWEWLSLGSFNLSQPYNLTVDDGYHYFFRLTPADAAGNWADREQLTSSYIGNGSSDQWFLLPLPPVNDMLGVVVEVRSGSGSLLSLATDPDALFPESYYLDAASGTLHFGDGRKGYVPDVGETLSVTWSGYDAATLVDRSSPEPARGLQVTRVAGGGVNLLFLPSPSDDVVGYEIYRAAGNASDELLTTLAPDEGYLFDTPAEGSVYRYRVVAVDRMGMTAPPAEATLDLSVVEPAAAAPSGETDKLPLLPLVVVALAVAALGGGAWWWGHRTSPEQVTAVPLPGDKSPFGRAGGDLACLGCGTIFTPEGSAHENCPGCGAYGRPPH